MPMCCKIQFLTACVWLFVWLEETNPQRWVSCLHTSRNIYYIHSVAFVSMGSVSTRRRAGLRRGAKDKLTLGALSVLVSLVNAGLDLITPHAEASLNDDSNKESYARRRELLPLPQPHLDRSALSEVRCSLQACSMLSVLVTASVRALNYMYLGKNVKLVDKFATSAQKNAVHSLGMRWLRLARHMVSSGEPAALDPMAFQRIIDKGAGGRYVQLKASAIDSLPRCARVDPLPFVSDDVRKIITDSACLVPPEKLHDLNTNAKFVAGQRHEYVNMIRMQCRSGKVVLATSCSHAAACFAVEKPDTGRQREVWKGTAFSLTATKPPAPPFLSSPSDLGTLESSDDRPLYMSVRDRRSFFDQLSVDANVQGLFGKPTVTLGELRYSCTNEP